MPTPKPLSRSITFAAFFHTLTLITLTLSLAPPPLFAKADALRILCLGDSLTFGLGVAAEKAWPSLVEQRLQSAWPGLKVTNAGSSGATSAFGPSALSFQLKRAERPDLVIYALGANDGLRGIAPEETFKQMDKAFSLLKDKGLATLLLGMKAPPNYGTKFPADFEKSYLKIVDIYKPHFLPFMLEGVAGQTALNQADGIHPNEKGHAKMADLIGAKIEETLQKLGFKKKKGGSSGK